MVDVDQLNRLQDKKNEIYHGLLKQIVNLSAGVIVLSITFRGQIAGHDPTAMWLLVTSWCLFGTVIISGLVEQRGHIDKWTELVNACLRDKPAKAGLQLIPRIASYAMLPVFLSAVISLIIFAAINLPVPAAVQIVQPAGTIPHVSSP